MQCGHERNVRFETNVMNGLATIPEWQSHELLPNFIQKLEVDLAVADPREATVNTALDVFD